MLAKYYRESYQIKEERKNTELWLQGLYFYEALCNVSPILHAFAENGTKPLPYPEKPYPVSKRQRDAQKSEKAEIDRVKQVQKANRERAKIVFEVWASQLDVPTKAELEEVEEENADN